MDPQQILKTSIFYSRCIEKPQGVWVPPPFGSQKVKWCSSNVSIIRPISIQILVGVQFVKSQLHVRHFQCFGFVRKFRITNKFCISSIYGDTQSVQTIELLKLILQSSCHMICFQVFNLSFANIILLMSNFPRGALQCSLVSSNCRSGDRQTQTYMFLIRHTLQLSASLVRP